MAGKARAGVPMIDAQWEYITSLRRQHHLTEGDVRSLAGIEDLQAMDRGQTSGLLDLLLHTPGTELSRMALKAKGQLELA